jgi:hypothetical protein
LTMARAKKNVEEQPAGLLQSLRPGSAASGQLPSRAEDRRATARRVRSAACPFGFAGRPL